MHELPEPPTNTELYHVPASVPTACPSPFASAAHPYQETQQSLQSLIAPSRGPICDDGTRYGPLLHRSKAWDSLIIQGWDWGSGS